MYSSWKLVLAALVTCALAAAGCGGAGEESSTQESPATSNTPAGDASGDAGDVSRIACSHILIQYAGALRAAEAVTRTKEEAEAFAREIKQRIDKGEDLGTLAGEVSDGPTKVREGYLGAFGRGQMVEAFENAAFVLNVGQVSDVVETPFGFHIIRRDELVEITASHILVAYSGAMRSAVTRSKDEARARAEEALAKVRGDEDFAEVAKVYSDDTQSGARGGHLGQFGRGMMVPEFEEVAFALDVGQISDIIETPFGYHVIKRTE